MAALSNTCSQFRAALTEPGSPRPQAMRDHDQLSRRLQALKLQVEAVGLLQACG